MNSAESPIRVWTIWEWSWPESWIGWTLLVGGVLFTTVWVWEIYRRDGGELGWGWRFLLVGLRWSVWGGVLLIALNPQERTQRTAFRPSRVEILIDRSLSMGLSADTNEPAGTAETRTAAVLRVLKAGRLIERLRANHQVAVYAFDQELQGPLYVWPPKSTESSAGLVPEATPELPFWSELEPRGLETRIGEALSELLRISGGNTLSGLVLISDGGQNAGTDPRQFIERAQESRSRLHTIGIGPTQPPVNLWLADVQIPTEVQKEDRFDAHVFVQAQGSLERHAIVECSVSDQEESASFEVVEQQEVILPEGQGTVECRFNLVPPAAGRWLYRFHVRPKDGWKESTEQDNQITVAVNVFDRPLKVLIAAGGPMREYQFVRNLLYRHKGVHLNVLLQTASVGSSQEAQQLLLQFPASREELYDYDVLICFDLDWQRVPGQAIEHLQEWVSRQGGGVMFVAGDVHTPQLAMRSATSAGEVDAGTPDPFVSLKELYPVILNSPLNEMTFDRQSQQPWPVQFTPEGERAEFLQLMDDLLASRARWQEFPGVYRCYPTAGTKAGAVVLMRFSDPRAQNEYGFPILLAQQYYGQGRCLYLGSAELWRLRALSEEDYERLWIKLIRELAQGRMRRGTKRGVLLTESSRLVLGQTSRWRVRLLDAQMEPLDKDGLSLQVIDPSGKTVIPAPRLLPDTLREGEYTAEFRVNLPGTYHIRLEVPDTQEVLQEEVLVSLPRLETQDVKQNVALLQELARETGGSYLTLQEAEQQLPALLPPRGETYTIEDRLKTLWDRDWLLYLLITILSLEWLLRKWWKLA